MKPIVVNARINPQDFFKLGFKQFYTKPMIIIPHVIIFISVIANLMLLSDGQGSENSLRNMFIVFSIIVVLLPFSIYRQMSKKLKTNHMLKEMVKYEFSTTKIKLKGETFDSVISWEKLHKVKETKSWFLFYVDKITASYVPKACFSSEADMQNLLKLIKSKPGLKAELMKG
ncbi:YcxB family protein [Flexithrix dorotheae]|uniref:YcxB family protein n=1 Tax=Flexithrix dorotheae TaxID=70993 RepID=UPI00039E1212|nr:YcxB family protein [Flexithrix dorotheae]